MKKIAVQIKGVAPLLQHKMDVNTEAQLVSKTKKNAGQSRGDDPKDFLYTVGDVIVQPGEHIVQAIIKQLGSYKIQGRGKKSYKEMGIGVLDIVPEFIPHNIQEWVPDSRTVVIKATKGRVVRIRPRFNDWSLDFTIVVNSNDLPIEVVKGALDDAGREGGIGDYRPRFGRFIVTKFHEL